MEYPEFKEKTYEKYFSSQMARITKVSFSPDQTDEKFLGFDDAFFLGYHPIWKFLTGMRASRIKRKPGFSVDSFEHISEDLSKRMPPFKFNLFVQYKRPVYLTSPGSSHWTHWGTPYYRYEITPHQQIALEKIENQSRGRAVGIYAAPGFKAAADLWAHVRAETIINASNVANVGRMRQHGFYTYVAQGFNGRGHSETTEIVSMPFDEIIETGLKEEGLVFSRHLKKMASLILSSFSDGDPQSRIFQQARTAMWAESFPAGSTAEALSVIESFSDAFSISYYAMG